MAACHVRVYRDSTGLNTAAKILVASQIFYSGIWYEETAKTVYTCTEHRTASGWQKTTFFRKRPLTIGVLFMYGDPQY